MKTILLWLRIIRPQTLFASLVPVAVALLCVTVSSVVTAVLTALCALCLQVMSNLINDYYDFVRQTDKKGRAGFRRALAEGEVTKGQMRVAIFIDVAIILGISAYLVCVGGVPILIIGLSALLFAWLYTATRWSLSYLGIADIFVFLYFGVVASCGTAYLQTGEMSWQAFHAGAVSGLISMCVLNINNLRDREDDHAAGKRTLAVRFGKRAAELIMLFEILLMPLFAWMAFGSWVPMLIVVPALLLYCLILKAQGAQYNRCLLMAGLCNVVYLVLCLLR